MAKAIKLKLENNSFDFILIGLVTTEPIYRLSWLINEKLNMQLADSDSIKLPHKQTKMLQQFSYFTSEEEGAFVELISNRGPEGLLVEEQKNIDYFLKISESDMEVDNMVAEIKDVKNISLVIKLQPSSLKSKNRLISYNK